MILRPIPFMVAEELNSSTDKRDAKQPNYETFLSTGEPNGIWKFPNFPHSKNAEMF